MNKIIYCPVCQDLKTLRRKPTRCVCGKAMGRMVDHNNAVINTEAVPVGISTKTFQFATQNRPNNGLGTPFTAFIMAMENKNIAVKSNEEILAEFNS